MAEDYPQDYPYRHDIVDHLFIRTADDNYVTARWCYSLGLYVDFFWLAVHCLEKYCKAVLLLNGRSAKGSHDIRSWYSAVDTVASELLPSELVHPTQVSPMLLWKNEKPESFIRRLYSQGNAHNRYQVSGYVQRSDEMLKLDQLVFSIRRLCRPLDAHFLGQQQAGVPDQSHRERMLQGDAVSERLNSRLEEVLDGRMGDELRHVLLDWNFSFAPHDYPHSPSRAANVFQVRLLPSPTRSGSNRAGRQQQLPAHSSRKKDKRASPLDGSEVHLLGDGECAIGLGPR